MTLLKDMSTAYSRILLLLKDIEKNFWGIFTDGDQDRRTSPNPVNQAT